MISQFMMENLADSLRTFSSEFNTRFDRYLAASDVPDELLQAVRYSALAPGKRIRPYLVIRCCELVGGKREDAWATAAAVECIHAFSLVHDDLPALDNDDLRRGRPTTHRQFGEAMAILAGDALVMMAFEMIANHISDAACAKAVTLELARSAGWSGMIGGQAVDITGNQSPPSIELARYIHDRKTASLFSGSCRIGAIAGGGPEQSAATLGRYGMHLGRAFQIADDLLDVMSNAKTLGKSAGKDAVAGKQSFPACVGVEASRAEIDRSVEMAAEELRQFGTIADDLRALARYAGSRNY
jgi:geranylgeranyl pyrophosphate synthase